MPPIAGAAASHPWEGLWNHLCTSSVVMVGSWLLGYGDGDGISQNYLNIQKSNETFGWFIMFPHSW